MKSKVQFRFVLAIAIVLLGVFGFVLQVNEVSAQQSQPPAGPVTCVGGKAPVDGKCPLENPAPGYLVGEDDFRDLLTKIIGIFLYFAGGIAVLFLMVGGFQYVAARGNEEATEKSKKTITGAIIGIIIIVMAFAIVAIVNNLLTRNDIGGGTTGGGTPSGTLQAGENCEADSECANNLVCIPTSPSGPKVCQ